MFGCRKIQGFIAESLYEELPERDRKTLDRHLAKCSQCREEARALEQLVQQIPASPVQLDRDLTPAVMARVREAAPVRRTPALRFAFSGAAALLVATLAAYGILASFEKNDILEVAQEPAISQGLVSPVKAGIEAARGLMAAHDFPGAYVVLNELIEAHPGDSLTGEALKIQAGLAFGELQWYPEALAGYRSLQQNYGSVYREDPLAWSRLDLLMESRGSDDDFAPLHDLEAARQHGSFERLEDVVGRHPGTFVASLAAEDMASVAVGALADSAEEGRRVYAMETALQRCTNPVAIAQLKVEVGHIYRDELHDFDKARTWYEKVANGDHVVLARLATESLGSLASPEQP